MDKLSIEEKAKRYDEAIEKLRDFYRDYDTVSCLIDVKEELANLIPELKESKDKRIKKVISDILLIDSDEIREILDANNVLMQDVDTWLEKQDEDKVKPKFKIGDWIVYNGNLYHIGNIALQRYYECLRVDGTVHTFGLDIDSKSHLWTIQDAKDGDVLSYRNGQWIFIYKEKVDDSSFDYHALYSTIHQDLTINDAGFTLLSDAIIPATKEQRDLLFQKMKEAGCEWDAEKKELKKIEQKPILDIEIPFGAKDSELEEVSYAIPKDYHAEIEDNKVVIKKGNKKSAEWSEEDEMQLDAAIHLVSSTGHIETANWLKSIKNRVLQQNITVTDEELAQAKKDAYNDTLDKIEYHSGEPTFYDGWSAAIWYLKKKNAQPQTTWKPSLAQLNALSIVSKGCAPDDIEAVVSLYNDLKKLKE